MHHAPDSESATARAAESAQPRLELVREVRDGADEMRAVRAELRDQLQQWRLGARVANAVLDVAHELIVNAHQHGAPPVRLSVVAGVTEVRVEVHDASSRPARLLPYRPGVSEHGLGLQLVRQLSRQWGQTLHDTAGYDASDPATARKAVWAVFPRPT
jgi:two-component sensor histidine kinase